MIPTLPEHFIGYAGIVARILWHKLERYKTEKLPVEDRRFLFHGFRGTGKTSLAMALASAVTGNSVEAILDSKAFNVEWLSGQSATVDVFREWRARGRFLPLFGNRIVQIVDEFDSLSAAANTEALSYWDSLPPHILFIATTNMDVSVLPARTQSRFKPYAFSAVAPNLVEKLLASQFPQLSRPIINNIAMTTAGDVRAAVVDATSQVEAMEALA